MQLAAFPERRLCVPLEAALKASGFSLLEEQRQRTAFKVEANEKASSEEHPALQRLRAWLSGGRGAETRQS